MKKKEIIDELKACHTYLLRSTACLEEADSTYRPKEELFTVAQHLAHIAQCVDWFMDGAFQPTGFDMNFEAHQQKISAVTSIKEAKKWLKVSFGDAVKIVGCKTQKQLGEILPENPILGKKPRYIFITALLDHTAHHRGALTLYARLLGKTPKMPYMES
jgi:uncharacterized damage-inducible protein DinB